MGSIIFSFRNFRKAFTLIELMIVISIIGVLTVALIPQMSQYMNRSRDAERLSNMSNIQLALEQYKKENKIYPTHSGGCAPTSTLITGKYLTKPSSSPSGATYNEGCGNNGEFGYGRKGGNGYILMSIMENPQGGNYSGSTDGFTGDITSPLVIAKTANIAKGTGSIYLRVTDSVIASANTVTIDPPEAGVCGITANTCDLGTSTGYSAGSCGGSQTWYCDGLNGGATSPQCQYINPLCLDCTLSGTTVVHNGSTPAYIAPSVISPTTCGTPITRNCTNGVLSGNSTYAYPTCIQNNKIIFNGNTATSGSMPDQIIASGGLATLTPNTFAKTGYSFSGWATTAGGPVAYANSTIYTMGSSNTTLYAKWIPVINGICGTASGTTVPTYPTANLCDSGTIVDVDTVGSDGVFNWSCNGSGGGTNMNCSATKILCTPVETLINGYYVIDPTQPNCSLGCNVTGLTDPVNKCILKLGTTYIAPGVTDVAKINTPCGGSASPCSPAILADSANVKGYCTNATWGGKTWFFPTYPTNTKNNLSLLLNTQTNYWTRHCENCDQYAGIKWRINSSGGSPTANTASYAVRCESSSAAAVNGSCGTSDGGTFASTPSANLCTSGTPSSISGTGPWTWNCGGLNGGTTEACNANLGYTVTFDGNGGSGHTPTTQVVASGATLGTLPTNPTRAGYTFNGWFTATTGGTAVTAATVIAGNVTFYAQWTAVVNGACGSANGVATASYPTTNWCTTGTKVDVDTTGSDGVYNWSCNGSGGGSSVNCSANKQQTFTCTAKPAIGTVWNTVSSYLQTWNGSAWSPANSTTTYNTTASTTSCNYSCAGGYGWDGTTCGLTQNGSCNNSMALGCSIGSYYNDNAQVACNTTRTWNCSGVNGGSNSVQCSIANAPCPINGVCGSANGVATASYPTANWCTTGTKADVDTTGSDGAYNWSCNGSGGGGNVSCSANKQQTFTCAAKPATGTVWNTVSSYLQTWNGSAWSPANSTTTYNATASTTSCNYTCASGYGWNGSSCLPFCVIGTNIVDACIAQ